MASKKKPAGKVPAEDAADVADEPVAAADEDGDGGGDAEVASDEESDDELDGDIEGEVEVAAPRVRPPVVAAPRPAKPRMPSGPPTKSTQALMHGAQASGAKQVKAGFALTKEADLAFALGFPHLEYIVDDHPDDMRAEMIAYERKGYRLGWPRNVAIRWCRITASKGFKRTPQGATELDGAGKKALKNGAPLSVEEVSLTLKSIFSDTSSYEDLKELVRLYEAFLGPELVATHLIDALEKASNNVWNHQDPDRASVMHNLGFVLLRLPAGQADKLRARLAAIFDKRVKGLPDKELKPRKGERGSLLRALDVVLNGKLGAERSGERNEDALLADDLAHVTRDPAFVCEAACRINSPDARLVFLGGEPVLDHLVDHFLRLRGMHNALIDNFAEVASPKAVALLQKIAKGREAAERAQAVLAARGHG